MPKKAYKGLVELLGVRPVIWIGQSKQDLTAFPQKVAGAMGYALYEAQKGQKHPHAKPLRGFGGAGVLEVVEDFDGDTFRAVYTGRLMGRVYVLHAFQKKSKHGIATPAAEMDRVNATLRKAEELHAAWSRERQRII